MVQLMVADDAASYLRVERMSGLTTGDVFLEIIGPDGDTRPMEQRQVGKGSLRMLRMLIQLARSLGRTGGSPPYVELRLIQGFFDTLQHRL